MDRLILLYQEYIELLIDEIDELSTLAIPHNWKSERHEELRRLGELITEYEGRLNG